MRRSSKQARIYDKVCGDGESGVLEISFWGGVVVVVIVVVGCMVVVGIA